jgi:WhiB family redox-sensing transcriptional regulator
LAGWYDMTSDPESWRDLALCAETDPEAFFPEKSGSTRDGKLICQSCDVRVECLDDALATNDVHFGTRGGLSARERRQLMANRRKSA